MPRSNATWGYDRNRVFVMGQSSGAGFTNEIACQYGDIVRGAAPVAGSLLSNECVGSTAVMLIAGTNDQLVPITIVEPTHQFWVAYNGFELGVSQPGNTPPCIDHSLGASLYPMQWCLHPGEGAQGHSWPGFATEAIWEFFSGLPLAEPTTDEPPGGGNDNVANSTQTSITFTLDYPPTIGDVYQLAVVLNPPDWTPGHFGAPIAFLNTDIDPGTVVPGTESTYVAPIQLPVNFHGRSSSR